MHQRHALAVFPAVLIAATCLAQHPASKPTTVPSLDEQVRELKAAGEPVTPADLKTWPTLPDDRNAAKVIWSLKDRMRRPTPEGGSWGDALNKRSPHQYRLPLSEDDAESIRKALAPQQDVLAALDRIPDLDGFDWGVPPSPYAVERADFPEGAYWGVARHQLYLDGLLAIHERDAKRAWRRVEVLRRLGEGMSAYPGHHDAGPLWPYLHELAALLAGDAAAQGLVTPENRPHAANLIGYWLDDRTVRESAILHLQRERVAVIDAYQLIGTGALTPKELAPWGHDVNKLLKGYVGVPRWPTVVAFYTGNVEALRQAKAVARDDSARRARAFVESFASGGFTPFHVAENFGPSYEPWHHSLCHLRATQVLAATGIAVQLYRMDHAGALPRSLNNLVPAYLSRVPADPGARQPAPLRLKVEDAGHAALWTTGRDGTDEGGKVRPPEVGRIDYRVKFDDVLHFERNPR